MWRVEIVQGHGSDLERYLQEKTDAGWDVRWVIVNGVDRWTVICWRELPTKGRGKR